MPVMSEVLDQPKTQVPRLYDGDRMGREEFHRRYEAMGPGVKAELIEGIVYLHDGNEMASPVSLNRHATPHFRITTLLGVYEARTPGLVGGIDSTVLLDGINEPQPDVLLDIPDEAGGQTRVESRGDKTYVSGGPELVIEIAASTARTDLNAKLAAYGRNGVSEYLVILADRDPAEVRWHVLDPVGPPKLIEPVDGIIKSRVFPGLWLDAPALLAGDAARLLATLDRGLASPEHADFVRRVQAAQEA